MSAPYLVYHPDYTIRLPGSDDLHPFDLRKFEKAMALLRAADRSGDLTGRILTPGHEISDADLRRVHTASYLESLRDPEVIADIVEIPEVALLPAEVIDQAGLRAMRLMTAGTLLAARTALKHGFAANLGGGFHHAKPAKGEGFCVYNDIAVAVAALRYEGALAEDAVIATVDLDAHQGNGISHCSLQDARVRMFDMYNMHAYPLNDEQGRARIDWDFGLPSGTGDALYLQTLETNLGPFLEDVLPSLVFYVAGTDVIAGDDVGHFDLSPEAVIRRDAHVVREARMRNIPLVMTTGGGYTRQSHQLIAGSLFCFLRLRA